MLEINEKNTLLKETENIKKPMEILELENVMTKITKIISQGMSTAVEWKDKKPVKLKIEKQNLFHWTKKK